MAPPFVPASPPRRPRLSHRVVIRSRAMEQQRALLMRQAVLLSAIDSFNAVNPMMVGQTLEGHLGIGPHQLRVTRHHPEDYLVQFEAPVHRNTLLRYGVLHVDGVAFLAKVEKAAS